MLSFENFTELLTDRDLALKVLGHEHSLHLGENFFKYDIEGTSEYDFVLLPLEQKPQHLIGLSLQLVKLMSMLILRLHKAIVLLIFIHFLPEIYSKLLQVELFAFELL